MSILVAEPAVPADRQLRRMGECATAAATFTAADASLRERNPATQGACAAKGAALRRLARRAEKGRANGLKRL